MSTGMRVDYLAICENIGKYKYKEIIIDSRNMGKCMCHTAVTCKHGLKTYLQHEILAIISSLAGKEIHRVVPLERNQLSRTPVSSRLNEVIRL